MRANNRLLKSKNRLIDLQAQTIEAQAQTIEALKDGTVERIALDLLRQRQVADRAESPSLSLFRKVSEVDHPFETVIRYCSLVLETGNTFSN